MSYQTKQFSRLPYSNILSKLLYGESLAITTNRRSKLKSRKNFSMSRMTPIALIVALLGLVTHASLFSAPFGEAVDVLPDRLIIKFSSPLASAKGTPSTLALPGNCNAILTSAQAQEIIQIFPEQSFRLQKSSSPYDLSSIYEIHFNRDLNIPKITNLLRKQPGVVYVEPVYLHYPTYDPNDPALGQGFQNYLATIKAREGWDISRGDSSVVIGIVDSGVDWQHEDLAAKIWRNPGEIPNNGIDDDGNGYKDDVRGWDFGGLSGTPDNDPREDRADHGTAVAGIAAAATDNGKGIAGVAFNCKIMAVKTSQNDVRPNGRLAIVYGYQGIKYAADNGASIINCSWGGTSYSEFEQDVINYATSQGALVVAAAGNGGDDAEFYPAAYQHVFSVASTNSNDGRSSFSSYGYWVGVSAQGEDTYSTWQSTNTPYIFLSDGTSFSSPMAAGVCALVKSLHKDWTPQQVAQQVRISADNINNLNSGFVKRIGFGRINVQRALGAVISPAVRWVNMTISEVSGDQDGIVDPGEDIGVTFTLTNYLKNADNLIIKASSTDANVSFITSSVGLGSLPAGASLTTSEPIVFHVASNASANHRVDFLLDIFATGYADWQPFNLTIRPLSLDLLGGNVATTVSSFGALGYYDYAGTGDLVGLGFQFPLGSNTALYHGGFIVATAANRVSDVSYGRADGTLTNPRYDFITAPNGEIRRRAASLSSSEIVSRFNDSAAEAPIGVEISQTALAWNDPPNDRFVILQYVIRNKSGAAINNLYAGYYLDWDLGDAADDFAGWDQANQLGYMYESNSNYYGICPVFSSFSNFPNLASSYRAVNNPAFVHNNRFTDATKYQFFTGGFSVLTGNAPDDWSQQMGYGPFSLQPEATATVAFAVLGSASVNDLKASAQAARAVFTPVGVDDDAPTPLRFELSQNLPNPFQVNGPNQTVIAYSLAKDAEVQVKIFNLLGQEVALLRQARQNAGRHAVSWNGRDARGNAVPTGIYFYQVLAGNVRMVKRMVVLR